MQQQLAQGHLLNLDEQAGVHALGTRIDEIERLAITNAQARDTS